ncbi:hypothetical protein M9458_002844, partial [Cirrhinus mrigala]
MGSWVLSLSLLVTQGTLLRPSSSAPAASRRKNRQPLRRRANRSGAVPPAAQGPAELKASYEIASLTRAAWN